MEDYESDVFSVEAKLTWEVLYQGVLDPASIKERARIAKLQHQKPSILVIIISPTLSYMSFHWPYL